LARSGDHPALTTVTTRWALRPQPPVLARGVLFAPPTRKRCASVGRACTRAHPRFALERNVTVLLCRVPVALVAQELEPAGEADAQHARVDHLVDEPELRRLVRVRELRLVLADEARARSCGILRGADLLPV